MPAPKLPEGLKSAWLLDCEAFAEAIAPDAELTVSQWADANRVLGELSAEPGPWRTDRVPYAREIMDALSASDLTQEVVLMKGTQVAGTEIGNNWIGYIVDVAPGPAMMVMPTSNTGKRSSRTRLAKMIEATPNLKAKISDASRDKSNTASLKEFPGGILVIAGANSAAELKSTPVRYLFEDELDEYPDDVDGQGPADELAEKRTDTYGFRRKIYKPSTPTIRGRSKIEAAYNRSDRRRYYVPCPHCRQEQVLAWGQMRFETRRVRELRCAACGVIAELVGGATPDICTSCKAKVDPVQILERDTGEVLEVWYECGHCTGRIDEHHKTAMIERGRWIAEAPGPGKPAGFHLSALYSPLGWFSWTAAVKKRLEAEKDPTGELLKVWTNTVLGETYAEASEQPSDLDLKNRAEGYRIGTVPMAGLMLTASVDVQADRLEAEVGAWGRGEESWLVQYEVIHGDTETSVPWDRLSEFLELTFPHESGSKLRIIATAIDAGFRTQMVYDFCRHRTHRHVFAVKGQARAGKSILGRPTPQDVTHKGTTIKGGVQLWPVGVDTAKARIYARLKITMTGPGCMHFPLGLPDEYYKGLTAERLVTRYHKGYARMSWEKDAGARNEPLDLKVYAYAAALYAGITRVNWDKLEATLKLTGADLFVAAAQAEEAKPGDAPLPEKPAAARATQPTPSGRGNFINRWRN